MSTSTELAGLIAPIARKLFGAPNRHLSSHNQLRFGTYGSMAVVIGGEKCGSWYDHESGCGGGVLELLKREKGLNKNEALKWIRTEVSGEMEENQPQRPRASARIVAEYGYHDEHGRLLFQVVRFEPKDFRQRRPDGNGGWIWSVKGARQVPYRLPELLSSAHEGTKPVFVVEGEKDVEAIRKQGFIATCNPGGASKPSSPGKPYRSKWPTSFSQFFAGRDVIVLGDHDEAGRTHAASVAASLVGSGVRVRIVSLPGLSPKGDVSDWFEAGGTPAELLRLAEQASDAGAVSSETGKQGCENGQSSRDHASHQGDDGETWPEPIDFLADFDLAGAPEIRSDHLPDALLAFVEDTAARMGVDPASIALAALVTCASVADDRWQLQLKMHDYTWTENPRLWGAILGSPSVLKTPVIRACTKPVELLDAAARRQHAADMQRHKEQTSSWKAAGSDPALTPVLPQLDRYLVESTTMEALSEALRSDRDAKQRAPAGKVLLRQDELSEWLAGFDAYRGGSKGSADRGAFLRLYNGGRHSIDRVGRGSFAIPNWSACILGGIQPEPIQRIARDAADDGLLQRFIYCVPSRQNEGEDRKPNHAALQRYSALFPVLAALHPTPDAELDAGGTSPGTVVLHANAHRYRLATNELAQAMALLPDTSSRLKAMFGKWPGLFGRLALTFHLIEIADARAHGGMPILDVVSEATAAKAATYMREIILPHQLRAEAVMFSTVQAGHARWIVGYILVRGQERISTRDVVQAYGPLRAPESRRELLEVMESLVTIGWLRQEEQSNPIRPPAAWRVNPAVLTMFAPRAAQEQAARAETRERAVAAMASALPQTRGAPP